MAATIPFLFVLGIEVFGIQWRQKRKIGGH